MGAELSCGNVTDRASDYLDATMAPGERERFARHLASCVGCTRYVEEIRQTIHGLGSLPREPMPDDMKERLRQALHSRQSA
jgi:anti-sigma factor RsiW